MADHLRMGLQRLAGGDWLELAHPLAPAQRRAKVELMATQASDFFAFEAGDDEQAIREASEELAVEIGEEHRRQGHPLPTPGTDACLHPLDAAARMVREDLCLHFERNGVPVLVAGSVCFPTRWSLAEKIGRSIDLVHGPVPGYSEALAAKVRQLLLRIKPGPGVWRQNWSIMPTDRWSLPGHHNEYLPESTAAAAMFHRTERQTLRRLPISNAVVFTIAVDVTPFADLEPSTAGRLAEEISLLPPEFLAYKGLADRTDVVPYLRALSRSARS